MHRLTIFMYRLLRKSELCEHMRVRELHDLCFVGQDRFLCDFNFIDMLGRIFSMSIHIPTAQQSKCCATKILSYQTVIMKTDR